jgi:hypothetical protein
MTNRWDSTHRCCQEIEEAIPANKHQASIFLDNAYWHIANLGAPDIYEAKAILHRAYMALDDKQEAA